MQQRLLRESTMICIAGALGLFLFLSSSLKAQGQSPPVTPQISERALYRAALLFISSLHQHALDSGAKSAEIDRILQGDLGVNNEDFSILLNEASTLRGLLTSVMTTRTDPQRNRIGTESQQDSAATATQSRSAVIIDSITTRLGRELSPEGYLAFQAFVDKRIAPGSQVFVQAAPVGK